MQQQIMRSRDFDDANDDIDEKVLAVKHSLKARGRNLDSIIGCKIEADKTIVQSQEKLQMCITKANHLKKPRFLANFSDPIAKTATVIANNIMIQEKFGGENAFDNLLNNNRSLFFNANYKEKQKLEKDSYVDTITLTEKEERDRITYGELADWIDHLHVEYDSVSFKMKEKTAAMRSSGDYSRL